MKKINKLMNSDWLHRLAVLVVGLICVVGNVQAESYDVFYKAEAKVGTTGAGLVYVSKTSTNSPTYQAPTSEETGKGRGTRIFLVSAGDNMTFHYYATPNEGYAFAGWKKNGTGSYVYTSPHFETDEIEITSKNESSPTTISYTAYFTKVTGQVKAYAAQPERGTVSVSNLNNVLGETITITAVPNTSLGVVFLGWNKDKNDHQNFLTTDNPYTLTVTNDTKGTYYAHFSEPATTVYCILRNVSTGKYLSLYGDGPVSDHTDNIKYQGTTYRNVKDGYVFSNCLKTIPASEIANNPLIVFKRTTTDVSGREIGYLATDVKTQIGTEQAFISTYSLIGSDKQLTFSQQNSGYYRIYAPYTTSVNGHDVPIESYLCDNGNNVIMQAIEGKTTTVTGMDWEITFLTEDQVAGAFGVTANAKFESGGKYYTSLKVPFAYKLLDGVNAYYLNPDDDNYNEKTNTLTLTQIPAGEIVPAELPVILECSSTDDPTHNRLLPVGGSSEYPIEGEYLKNMLRGYNPINCQDTSEDRNKKYQAVANDHDFMYVFSIKNNDLGFYHLNGATTTIPKNKAYLHLGVKFEEISDELNNQVKTVKLAFGSQGDDDLLNSINWTNEEADDIDQPIYNLQGVQVKNPEKGIYIRGGKKYLVK